MPPFAALLLWLILLLALLRLDPAKEQGTSPALWVPLIWIFIIGTRLPSQWLGVNPQALLTEAFEEGSSLDRAILSFLIFLAIGILVSRSFNWGAFFGRNFALMTFLLFALISVSWSDAPYISFKRWFKDLGDYLVIFVVVSDPHPLVAVRALLRRLCYLLIPLSILVVKYFPQIGKQYDPWTGMGMYVGATTSKNMLGVACLVSGIFFFWDTVARWSDRKGGRTKRIIALNGALFGMTFWLLRLANSATSNICLVLGCLVIAAAHTKGFKRNPAFLKVFIPAGFVLYLILAFGFDMNGQLASGIGRDPTLTGRTDIWKAVLSTNTNPLIGTGYEAFWLGPRLLHVWQLAGVVNEAHNGYLELYLNLGFIGLFLLSAFLIASYWQICRSLTTPCDLSSLSLALWTVLLFYNVTEAAFKGSQLMWVTFLLGAITLREWTGKRVHDPTAMEALGAPDPFRPLLPLEPTSLRR